MANVKERYTQVTRDSRSGRFNDVKVGASSRSRQQERELAEEQRLAETFRKRARDDYRPAPKN